MADEPRTEPPTEPVVEPRPEPATQPVPQPTDRTTEMPTDPTTPIPSTSTAGSPAEAAPEVTATAAPEPRIEPASEATTEAMPEARTTTTRPDDGPAPRRRTGRHEADVTSLVFGLLFLGIAAVWVLVQQDVVSWPDASRIFPVLLVVAGLAGLVSSLTRSRRSRGGEHPPA